MNNPSTVAFHKCDLKKKNNKGSPLNITENQVFDTTTPEETLKQIVEWLDKRKFDTLGIASFGPVDLSTDSKTYGYITTTPKEKWWEKDFEKKKCLSKKKKKKKKIGEIQMWLAHF